MNEFVVSALVIVAIVFGMCAYYAWAWWGDSHGCCDCEDCDLERELTCDRCGHECSEKLCGDCVRDWGAR